uniref:Zn(2)-C6 fungal-type domain-containing protein n=1 Tax=Psilocybe cubensis TaxID=181762 RepID=A0A8H7XLV5_PSICU
MYNFTNSRQRSQDQPFSPSEPYRQQEYYVSHNMPGHVLAPPPDNPSRQYAGAHSRADFYQASNEHHYSNARQSSDSGFEYNMRRESNSPVSAPYIQSYDRRASGSSEMHMPPGLSYQEQIARLPSPSTSKRNNDNGMLDTYSHSASHFTHGTSSAMTGPASEHSGDSEFWPNIGSQASHVEPKPKKARREKPRIELAPDQPPTTQGKPRARVYVACLQCRTRKIRCDGAKPICHNCGRRANGNGECNYDSVPKRRGPDKTPGARQRMARDIRNDGDNGPAPRRRRRTRDNSTSDTNQTNHQQFLTRQSVTGDESPQDGDMSSSNVMLPSPEIPADLSGNTSNFVAMSNYSRSSYSPCGCHGLTQCPGILGVGTLSNSRKAASVIISYDHGLEMENIVPSYNTNRGFIIELDENGNENQESNGPELVSEPSLNFTRKVWWDSLLSLYLSPTSTRLQALTVSQRMTATQSITADLRFLFRASNYWFSFFHIPSFFGNFYDPIRRERIQPSLILALLALATFWQSSEVGYGKEGRERALRFRDEAQAAMDASFNAGWIDETLAQAAWLLALFEICAHPRHSSERSTSSMVMLDSIIRSLSLTSMDAGDPNTSMFSPGTVPAVLGSPKSQIAWLPEQFPVASHPGVCDEIGCSCQSFTLEEHWPSAAEHAPLWSATPAWDDTWTEAEIRKESCRRLCWSSMMLAAGHISYTTSHRSQGLDLFISDPANYALLFSGESVAKSPALSSYSPKDTVWALHDRSFLLWHGCIRMRGNTRATDNDKAEFAMKAWLEADSLEQALNRHTCAIERAFIFQAREYIFNTRMCISYEFQRYIPLVSANVSGLFHRDKAEEWLTHQATVAERFMLGLHTVTGHSSNLLARRPFFVFWFMGQIHRSLALWEVDNTLTVALDVCKALIPAID